MERILVPAGHTLYAELETLLSESESERAAHPVWPRAEEHEEHLVDIESSIDEQILGALVSP